jgi:hypothetical protein
MKTSQLSSAAQDKRWKTTMKDTDWRPTPCPHCGVMREAREYPFCQNNLCHYFALRGDDEKQKERTVKTELKYLWENATGTLVIVSDLSLLFKQPDFDADNDKIFELGPEVKLKMQIVAIPAQRLTRDHSWENKE